MYFTNPELYWSCTTISAAPQLFTGRISFFPSFLQPRLKQDFVPTTIDRIYQSRHPQPRAPCKLIRSEQAILPQSAAPVAVRPPGSTFTTESVPSHL
ncbi:hypothetical protein N7535_009577 [Penicillium sp. DV-2018c]|nr:hypothetical protein N7535_009577 [Penicillium sp. DV-2018c]